MAQFTEDNEHHLDPYLRSILPTLGLDYETYGPYVTGTFPTDYTEQENENDEKNHQDKDDASELDCVLDLLRQSTESHCDDDEAFASLKAELVRLHRHFISEKQMKKERDKHDQERKQEERRRREIEEAQRAQQLQEMERERKLDDENNEDTSRKALVDKYAYEDSVSCYPDGNPVDPTLATSAVSCSAGGGKAGASEVSSVNPNRSHASCVNKEQNREIRKQYNMSKKAAREETKNAKNEKEKAKEERRRRAMKGERRR